MYLREASVETQKPFTADKIGKLLVASYRFSQGNQLLQQRLLEQIVSANSGSFIKKRVRQARKAVIPTVTTIAQSSVHKSNASNRSIKKDMQQNVNARFPSILKQDRKGLLQAEPLDIARLLLQSDVGYISGKGSKRTYGGLHPHTSYFIRYAVAGKPTGLTEYDDLFAVSADAFQQAARSNDGDGSDLRLFTRSPYRHLEDIEDYKKVVSAHLAAYPEEVNVASAYFEATAFEPCVPSSIER